MRCTSQNLEMVVLLLVPDDEPVPVSARWSYRAEDPYTVNLDLAKGDGTWVTWSLARSLLDHGMLVPSGEGDVRIWPDEYESDHGLYLTVSSPSGTATFLLPLAATANFLLDTYALVPAGTEGDHLDIDGTLTLLLAG